MLIMVECLLFITVMMVLGLDFGLVNQEELQLDQIQSFKMVINVEDSFFTLQMDCLLYTSDAADE